MAAAKIGAAERRQQAAAGWRGAGRERTRRRPSRLRTAVLTLTLGAGLGGCVADRDPPPGETADSPSVAPLLTRETIFVGRRDGEPLIAVIAFRTIDGSRSRSREVRGWLGHGEDWDTFLDERWSSGAHGSAWSVVPHGPFRVAAGGPSEVEAFWFDRGGRRLRLEVGGLLAEWTRDAASRVNLFSGELTVGGERSEGWVMELLRLRRPAQDPPGTANQLLLTSGDSLVLVLAAADAPSDGSGGAPGIVWVRRAGATREWDDVRIVARGGRPIPEARREIPRGWGFVVPEGGLRGEVRPLAYTAEIGLVERTGRRGIEARYTVRGWVELGGERLEVSGLARHVAE